MAKNEIDLLIVKPAHPQKIYGDLSISFSAIEPPVWGGMVAEFIRQRGYSVQILDMEIENLTLNEFAEKIVKSNPLSQYCRYGLQSFSFFYSFNANY